MIFEASVRAWVTISIFILQKNFKLIKMFAALSELSFLLIFTQVELNIFALRKLFNQLKLYILSIPMNQECYNRKKIMNFQFWMNFSMKWKQASNSRNKLITDENAKTEPFSQSI